MESLKEENMYTEKKEYRPSDFMEYPWDNVEKSSEAAIAARNIMVILSRRGDIWRELSWNGYSMERKMDADFSNLDCSCLDFTFCSSTERSYFESVRPYTVSEEKARSFSETWRDVV
jgi:hypothetical protein